MNIKIKHAKRILKQYGKNLKAAEKNESLVSNYKCFWIDTKDLTQIAEAKI